MLVEIHMLQNHAPSNLNRDDTGSPKDAVFGGVRRSRISSQALKRAIRRSPVFEQALEQSEIGWRTRQLPEKVRESLLERGLSEEMADIGALKASGFGTSSGKEQKPDEDTGKLKTAQMMFLTPQDIEKVADIIFDAAEEAKTPAAFRKVTVKALQTQARDDGLRPISPDVALFGRMITSDAFRDVEAAIQTAHAISTHKMEHEFDYFTAVDDLIDPLESEDDKGAGMIGDVEFNSACFYKYFSLNLDGFIDNLLGVDGDVMARDEAVKLVISTVLAFLQGAVFTTPSGKQNTFAAHQLPDAILVEVREQRIPVSYANAFVRPVVTRSDDDLVENSIHALTEHVKLLTRKFSLQSIERFWFSTQDVDIEGTTQCDTLDDLLEGLQNVIESGLENG